MASAFTTHGLDRMAHPNSASNWGRIREYEPFVNSAYNPPWQPCRYATGALVRLRSAPDSGGVVTSITRNSNDFAYRYTIVDGPMTYVALEPDIEPIPDTNQENTVASGLSGSYTSGGTTKDDQVPFEPLQADVAAAIKGLLEADDKVAWIGEPTTAVGPYGGVSTSVLALTKNAEGVYEGVLVSVYANERSTKNAVKHLEAELAAKKEADRIDKLIAGQDPEAPAEPKAAKRR